MSAKPIQLELTGIKRDWIEDVAPRVVSIAPGLGQFTADDLHERIKPGPQHLNWWGCLLAKLSNAGLLRKAGYRASKRPEANGRVISVWEVVA